MSGKTGIGQHRHPVNRAIYEEATRGQRIADRVTGFMGSWPFIGIQTVIVAIWLTGNIWLLAHPFDPFPFILLKPGVLDPGRLRRSAHPPGRQPGCGS
jgi:uncharacterized membrane protein